MTRLIVHRSGPGNTVQDLGRPGYLEQGLSRGGAADAVALIEGAALLGQPTDLAALEITTSLDVAVTAPTRIALTGAPKQVLRNGETVPWNTSLEVWPQDRLTVGTAQSGTYAYLHVAGGLDTPVSVGGRGTHLAAHLGSPIAAGSQLPIGPDPAPHRQEAVLPQTNRFDGGVLRVLDGPQTALFPAELRARFFATEFTRTAWGNRQGVKLGFDGEGFRPAQGLTLVSEVVVPGDIQVTGDGTPYVLGAECQTIGGYPRIGTVVPNDLTKVMQATPGSRLRFQHVSIEDALRDHLSVDQIYRDARARLTTPGRAALADLMTHNLISGAITGWYDSEDLQ